MVPICIVDAFTDKPFGGNPAGVCILEQFPADQRLQLIAREMNLAETAFLVRREGNEFDLRWMTPCVEVALCGHATLASAHLLWQSSRAERGAIGFHTKSGRLTATLLPGGEIELDFPAKPATGCEPPPGLLESLGVKAIAVGKNQFDYLVELAADAEVRAVRPDFGKLIATECRGVIVTAKSADPQCDFVSRFFAPKAGVNEDPVTGSAHCCLSEWWGEKLGKTDMLGFQASERGGVVRVKRVGDRVKLIGRAVTVTSGHLVV